MKSALTLLIFVTGVSAAHAATLTPVTSSQRDCTAKVTDATYRVQAACYKGKQNENRMWFPEAVLKDVSETGINAKFIRNIDAACASTNLYSYFDLFGNNKKPESEIQTREVEIAYSHLDAAACYQ